MPKRTDLKKIFVIGSGPIVIGQGCEFDYSGTQACKALREEGYEVVLVNSNPATIMTDPSVADRTYVEPLTPEFLERIIERERPDALLPTVGGQTGLNLAVALGERGVLERYGVRLIGANLTSIRTAEDRNLFKAALASNKPLAAPVVDLEQLEATKLPLSLIGTAAASNPSASWAAVQDHDSRAHLVLQQGDSLKGKATVERIEPKRIVLRENGQLRELALSDDLGAAPAAKKGRARGKPTRRRSARAARGPQTP